MLKRILSRFIFSAALWGTVSGRSAQRRKSTCKACNAHTRLILYRQWQDRDLVAVIVPTENVLALEQIGAKAEPNLFVLYLANRGILISGYQFSSMDTIRIPGDAVWLR